GGVPNPGVEPLTDVPMRGLRIVVLVTLVVPVLVLTDLPMRGLLVTLVVPVLIRRLVVELKCGVVPPVLTPRETVVVRRALTGRVAGRPTERDIVWPPSTA